MTPIPLYNSLLAAPNGIFAAPFAMPEIFQSRLLSFPFRGCIGFIEEKRRDQTLLIPKSPVRGIDFQSCFFVAKIYPQFKLPGLFFPFLTAECYSHK